MDSIFPKGGYVLIDALRINTKCEEYSKKLYSIVVIIGHYSLFIRKKEGKWLSLEETIKYIKIFAESKSSYIDLDALDLEFFYSVEYFTDNYMVRNIIDFEDGREIPLKVEIVNKEDSD